MDEKKICTKCKLEPRSCTGGVNNCWCQKCITAANNQRRRGISQIEFDWLFSLQYHACALCKQVSLKTLHTDHDYSCHPFRHSCKKCIRGLLCESCNRQVLPTLERHPHLQNDFVKAYLKQRPFIDSCNNIVHSILES